MKKLLVIVTGMALSLSLWADTNEEVLKRIEQMQRDLRQQQTEIQNLRSQLNQTNNQVSQTVRSEVDRALEGKSTTGGDGGGLKISDHISKLKLQGDLRLRYEAREVDKGSSDTSRDRFRTRLRIGAVWEGVEGWEVGVGIASGGSGSTSTNDDWSSGGTPFDTGDLRIDYAYAKHTWEGEGSSFALLFGQHKNPYVSSYMLWDSDVRPAGVTALYKAGGIFATAGAYKVLYADEAGNKNGDNAELAAAQIGWKGDLGDGMGLTLATAYYHYDSQTSQLLSPKSADYDYHIGDLYAKFDMKAGDVRLSFFGDIWKNFGADGSVGNVAGLTPKDENLGWVAGVGARVGDFSFSYSYGYVEADSVSPDIKDGDFGATAGLGNTNVEGHKLGLGYKITKNFSIDGTAFFLDQIVGDDSAKLYQLDLNYKF